MTRVMDRGSEFVLWMSVAGMMFTIARGWIIIRRMRYR